MRARVQNPKRACTGQSIVEFALVLPLFLLLIFAILEFGRAFYAYSAISNAAREGARYGVTNPNDTAGIQNRVITAAIGLGLTANDNIVVSYPDGGKRVQVNINYNFQSIIPLVTPSFKLTASTAMVIE